LDGHEEIVRGVAFSPDGAYLASGSLDRKICLWDVKRGKLLQQLEKTSPVVSVIFMPDSKGIGFLTYESAEIWDITLRKTLWKLDMKYPETITFSPRDNCLIVGSADGQLVFLDRATGKEVRRIAGHLKKLTSIDVSPDGEKVASADIAGTIFVRNVDTGKVLNKIETARGHVESIKFSSDGKILGGAGFGYAFRLWSVASGVEIGDRPAHYSTLYAVAFPFTSEEKVVTGSENEIRLWEPRTGRCLATVKTGNKWIDSLACSPDGHYIAAGTEDNKVWLWTITDKQRAHCLEGPKGHVWSVIFSPDSQYLACGGEDGTVCVWNVSSGKELWRRAVHDSATVHQVFFSSDGTRVQVLAGNNVTTFNVLPGGKPVTLTGFRQSSWIAPTSDDHTFVSLEDDRICIRSAIVGTERRHFSTDDMKFACATLSPDRWLLATGGWDHVVRLWEVATGKEIVSFRGHSGDIRSLAFDQSGSLLVSGSEDTTGLVWDLRGLWFGRDLLIEAKPVDLERCWTILAGEDVPQAYSSMEKMASAGKGGSIFLREKLLPRVLPPGRIDGLLRELANDRFETRELAFQKLHSITTLAEGPLRDLLASSRDAEVKRRLQELVERIESMEMSREDLRWFRALRILERINDLTARQLIGELAKGDQRDRRTLEASLALQRITRLDQAKP
jgi:WD40 repeat protein